jgi:hypothetical protein
MQHLHLKLGTCIFLSQETKSRLIKSKAFKKFKWELNNENTSRHGWPADILNFTCGNLEIDAPSTSHMAAYQHNDLNAASQHSAPLMKINQH